MAEEHRCQAPEGHRLCANNCGFFGSPATLNLCSKCYGDLYLKEQQQVPIKPAAPVTVCPSLATESTPTTTTSSSSFPTQAVAAAEAPDAGPQPNRCSVCRKRVGLTGFRCRCCMTFCGAHRYPERHGCSFDFKKLGREEIARANPVVKAEKLDKI